MQAKLPETDQMTVEEFPAFTKGRPVSEDRELIEGIAVMSPSPTELHQEIAGNFILLLMAHKRSLGTPCTPMIGVGTRVPVCPSNLPRPDVFVKDAAPQDSSVTSDAVLLLEVLSKSDKRADQAWRKRVNASFPNSQHYVSFATRTAECVRYDRADGWPGERVAGLRSTLELPCIGAKLPVRDIYELTSIK